MVSTGSMLLANTSNFCSSPMLQHGFASIDAIICILLPLASPALIGIVPPTGLAALLGVVPAAGTAASAALCQAYQSSWVVLGCAAICCHLYTVELRQRQTFLCEMEATQGRQAVPATPQVPGAQ